MKNEVIEELVKYVNEKANEYYSDDFPDNLIEVWIRDFFNNQPERASEKTSVTGFIEKGKIYPLSLPKEDAVL